MKLVKLFPRKNSKFHFGYLSLEINDTIFHSDSIFSAICNNYNRINSDGIDEFIKNFPRISSLFYGIKKGSEEVLFLPKPLMFKLPKSMSEEDRKLAKKVKFISWGVYSASFDDNWADRKDVCCNDEKNCVYLKEEYEETDLSLFSHWEDEKVGISRETSAAEEGRLYVVSSIIPHQDVFFYFLADEINDDFKKSVELITRYGIGGELSVGYGQIKSVEIISKQFTFPEKSNYFTNLSVVFPTKSELGKTEAYKLIERKGFIYYSSQRKKPLIGFSEGSVFNGEITGSVIDVSNDKNPAKKFGKAFLIPYVVRKE